MPSVEILRKKSRDLSRRARIFIFVPHQVEEEFSSGAIIQHEEELVSRLERHVEAHDEWMLHVAQDVTFCLRVFNLRKITMTRYRPVLDVATLEMSGTT